MISNLSAVAMPADVQAAVNTKIEELQTLLRPWLHQLSDEERAGLNQMGDRSEHFVYKAADHAKAAPALLPAILSGADFAVDVANIRAYKPVIAQLRTLCSGLEDGLRVAGSEALEAALLFYGSVKTAAAKGVGGAEAIHEDLATRFPQRGRRKAATAPSQG
ncbi:MAG: hypothetical protein EOO16_10360 [Chitinophagaceae bacterium]|nr:MAG: hypothetical protein EOO16_10360 [Chitinophagaceae bacterium]